MLGVSVLPRRVYGVSLGFGEEAGRDSWVCRATPGADGIRIESVASIATMPGGATRRDDAYRVLTAKLLEVPRSAWGIDAPFSSPLRKPREAPVATGISEHWLTLLSAAMEADSLDEFLASSVVADRAGDRGRLERLYRVARGVLAPARAQGPVAVLPFDPLPLLPAGTPPAMLARAPSIYVLEVLPSRLLEVLERETGGPVNGSSRAPEGRETLLRLLHSGGQIRPMARKLRAQIVESDGGRAFDAVLAAVAAWRGYRTHDHSRLHADPRTGHEGHVYC